MPSPGLESSRPPHRTIIAAVFLLLIIFLQLSTSATVSAATCSVNCDEVTVEPGKYDLLLGDDFPGLGSVKLSYPNSTILTDSIGDLLFTVTLRPDKTKSRTLEEVPEATLYTSIDIYIPPDFTNLATDKFWTSFSNDYNPNRISLGSGGSDQIGPGWWRVSVRNIIVTSDPDFVAVNNRVFAANKSQYIRLFQVTSPVTAGRYFFKVFINGTSIGNSRFPTIVVEGSRNAAYISGTLRDIGDTNTTLAGKPISIPNGTGARILATGIDYLGRSAAAQAFINSTARGQYTIFGVAPGTYNISAYAAGFRPTIRPYRVSVLPAQSLEGVDIYMPHSVNITGIVRSTTIDNEPIIWGSLYAFNGHPINRTITIRVFSLDGSTIASTPSFPVINKTTQANFSIQRELEKDGRIPQDYASYTSGLSAGDYLLRAYATSYIQLDEVRIHVTNETKVSYSEIRLIRGTSVNVTVHFRDFTSSLVDSPPGVPGTLTVQLFDQAGNLRGSNSTSVPFNANSASLEIQGQAEARSFGVAASLPPNSGLLPGTYHIYASFTSSPRFTGFANVGVRDYYYQLEDHTVTLGLSSKLTINITSVVSFSIFRSGALNLTIYSVDAEKPGVPRNWTFPRAPITLKIIDSLGNVYSTNTTQLSGKANVTFAYAGLLTDNYEILVQTFGYDQVRLPKLHVVMGGTSDVRVLMRQDPMINLTLVFKTEGLFAAIDSTAPFAQPINHLDSTPVRIEVFDMLGNFVAANRSYISNRTGVNATMSASFLLAGFNQYYGNPKQVWSGFYDATDAGRQDEGGIPPGTYMILVWVDGYYQSEPQAYVTLGQRGNVSLVVSMERASRIHGIIAGPDFYDEARPLSWVSVGLEPGDYTTFSLDGFYQVWVPGGTYGIGFSAPGYSRQTMSIVVPSGSDLQMNVWLDYG
jgi:hypothetical protein